MKEVKTNAMRILDGNRIQYKTIYYECGDFIDGLHTAEKTKVPIDQTFKTLVVQGKSKQYYVLVIPIKEEIELKKASKVLDEKSIDMIPVKDITAVTGYVRGGCTAIGMKKHYPTYIHESAMNYNLMYISGGKLGVSLCLSPKDLVEVSGAILADLVQNK